MLLVVLGRSGNDENLPAVSVGLQEEMQRQAEDREDEQMDEGPRGTSARFGASLSAGRQFEVHHFRYALTTSITSWLACFCSEVAFRPGWTT